MFNATIFEQGFDLIPSNLNADANNDVDGDRINTANVDRVYPLLIKPSGSGGDDLSIALQQHTAASGGSSKALLFDKLWYKKAASSNDFTAVGQWTAVVLTTPTSDLDLVDVNGVDLATDTVGTMVLVEVKAAALDVGNGYKFVSAHLEGDDIGNALVANLHYLTTGEKYVGAIPTSKLS